MTRPSWMIGCTEECERIVYCAACGRRKHPVGRDPGMDNGMCGIDCSGYRQEPTAGHLWPGELAEADAEPVDE